MTCAIFSLPFRIHLRDLLSGSAAADPNRYGDHFICVVLSWINDLLQSIQKLLITCVVLKFHSGGFFPFLPQNCENILIFCILFIFVSSWPNINKQNILFSGLCSACSVMHCSVQLLSPSPTPTIYLRDQSTFRPLFTWLINWEWEYWILKKRKHWQNSI